MKKILINVLLGSVLLGSSCDRIPELPVTERRIHCESNTLRAHDPNKDMQLCPEGTGQSAFTQMDMAIMEGEFRACMKRLELCQKNCSK